MRQKPFTKKEIKEDIKKILHEVRIQKLDGEVFSLVDLIGDYQFDTRNRYIKEVLFESNENFGPKGARWFLRYPLKTPRQLAKKVMKFKLAY